MNQVFDDIFAAISYWLQQISLNEIRIEDLDKKFKRLVLQIQYEGDLSLSQVSNLENICNLWLRLLKSIGGSKEEVLSHLLQLFYYGQIEMDIVIKIIMQL